MRLVTEIKLDFDDVLIRPKRSTLSSRMEVQLERTFLFPYAQKEWTGIPIIASNMDGIGTIEMMKSLSKFKLITALHKYHEINAYKNINDEYTFITIGISEQDEEKINKLFPDKSPRLLCIDVANGYTERFTDFVKKMREKFPETVIMAGNIATGEMAEQLILSGADIVKVGIGPGSVCTTRKMTGVGYPQLSATIECADAAHGLKGLVCTDGGCKTPGDIAKAFGGGADFVMLGSIFAGHEESGLEILEKNGEKYIEYYGSSSDHAMQKNIGNKAHYRAAEGKIVHVPYQGEVSNTVTEILGGLRSACTYVGANKLKEMAKRTTFVHVNRQLNDLFN